jgi:hypothetical protein
MYLLDGAPYGRSENRNTILTHGCDEVSLIGDSRAILETLTAEEWRNTHVAYVSRTTYPKWAKLCIRLLTVIEDKTLDSLGSIQARSFNTHVLKLSSFHGMYSAYVAAT